MLRRPSILDGERPWEFAEWNFGGSYTVPYLGFSTKRRSVTMSSDGRLLEHEWNSSTGAWITGSNRDGGNAITSAYWQSKIFVGPNRRVANVYVERDSYSDTPTVTITSSRTTASYTLTSGKRHFRAGPLVQGWDQQFKVELQENSSPVRRVEVTEYVPGGKRLRA